MPNPPATANSSLVVDLIHVPDLHLHPGLRHGGPTTRSQISIHPENRKSDGGLPSLRLNHGSRASHRPQQAPNVAIAYDLDKTFIMATYEQSPQDEGYSEDPLTVGIASAPVPPWLASMSVSERTGTSGVDEGNDGSEADHSRIRNVHHR